VAVNNKIKSMSVKVETKLDSKVELVDREVRQVKDALKENNEQITRQQRENVELMNQRTIEELQAENQLAQLQSEIKYLKGRISEIVPQSPVVLVLGDNTNQGVPVLANTSSNQ
jgi:predicted RNase H-like nuclease (RuvC/YqgF family)